jgi:threonine/homoserine/homoserine lactone efflux protein
MLHPVIAPTVAVFLFASLVLAVTPGPGVIYVLAAARLGPGLSRLGVQSVITRFAGLTFIALGLVVACSDSRSAR